MKGALRDRKLPNCLNERKSKPYQRTTLVKFDVRNQPKGLIVDHMDDSTILSVTALLVGLAVPYVIGDGKKQGRLIIGVIGLLAGVLVTVLYAERSANNDDAAYKEQVGRFEGQSLQLSALRRENAELAANHAERIADLQNKIRDQQKNVEELVRHSNTLAEVARRQSEEYAAEDAAAEKRAKDKQYVECLKDRGGISLKVPSARTDAEVRMVSMAFRYCREQFLKE